MLIYEYGSDPRSYKYYLSSSESKAWKRFRPVRDLTHDLCDTGASLYQLSWQANWELVIILVPNKPSKWWINDCKYNEIIYVNWGWRNGYGSEAILTFMNITQQAVKIIVMGTNPLQTWIFSGAIFTAT